MLQGRLPTSAASAPGIIAARSTADVGTSPGEVIGATAAVLPIVGVIDGPARTTPGAIAIASPARA